jgi:polar amino acid transport system substrate-binding protein
MVSKWMKAFACVGALFAMFQVQAAENLGKVTLRADTWCPYNCKPGSNKPGLMIEVAFKAFGKDNVDYQLMPWKRAILEARSGNVDGIVGAAQSDAPDFYNASSLSKSVYCFYKKGSSNWQYADAKSLKGQKMGFISAYAYPDVVLAYQKENDQNVEISGDAVLINLLRMVNLGRIDITVDDENVLNYVLSENADVNKGVKNGGCMQGAEEMFDISMAFSPKFQQRSLKLVRRVNDTIREMIDSGEMQKLAAKYNMKKWW